MSFQILRRFWWVFVVLVSGLFTNTFAQDTSTSEATPESFQNLTMIVRREDLLTPEFTEAFSAALLAAGHPIQFMTEDEFRADPTDLTPVLRFKEAQHGIEMELLIHPFRELSPILIDLPEPVRLTGALHEQVWIATQYARYALRDCSDTLESLIAIPPSSTEEAIEVDETVEPDADIANQVFDPLASRFQFDAFYLAQCMRLGGMNLVLPSFNQELVMLSPEVDIADTVYHVWHQLQRGDQADAFQLLDELAERWSDDLPATVEILRKQSQFQALVNDFDSAMDAVQQAIDLAEDAGDFPVGTLADLYIQRGQVQTLLYEWDNAIADYTIAINFAPDDEAVADAYYYRGFIYYTTLFDRERALPDFERYLDLAAFGEHRENALQYQADIEAELEALSG